MNDLRGEGQLLLLLLLKVVSEKHTRITFLLLDIEM